MLADLNSGTKNERSVQCVEMYNVACTEDYIDLPNGLGIAAFMSRRFMHGEQRVEVKL
jgi:hypothetical protein